MANGSPIPMQCSEHGSRYVSGCEMCNLGQQVTVTVIPARQSGEKPRTTAEAAQDLTDALRDLFYKLPTTRLAQRIVDRLSRRSQ